jgi:hypothetical protein
VYNRVNNSIYYPWPFVVDTFGIRGGGPVGADLRWDRTFYLKQESTMVGGVFRYPARNFWSGRVRIPKSGVGVGDTIRYKYLIGYDWGRHEPNERVFRVPTSKRDTTVYFSFFADYRPNVRLHRDTVRVRYRVNLQNAISTGGFTIGDTLVVQSGFFGTARDVARERRITRVGVSTVYEVVDTVRTDI